MLAPIGCTWYISITLPTDEVKLLEPEQAKKLAREMLFDYTIYKTMKAKREGDTHIKSSHATCDSDMARYI